MTDTQSESTGSRKKLLIPLVALMLCAVSIVGAGYAYNSTVTNTFNSVVAEGTTINLYDGSDNVVTEGIISLEFMTYTHALNGKAIYPLGHTGIDATDTSADLDYAPGEPLNNYAPGYYLETTYKNGTGAETAAGFHPVAATTDIDTAAEVAALAIAPETKGVFALGTYTLKIGNATDNAVDVTFKADYNAAPTLPAGVRDILVTFTGNGATVSKEVVSVKANVADQVIANLASSTASAEITVNTYVIVSDSYSTVPLSLSKVAAAVDFTFGTAIVPPSP